MKPFTIMRTRILISLWTLVMLACTTQAQDVYEPDSLVLITSLTKVNDLLTHDGDPYTGEAYFLRAEDDTPMVMRSYNAGVQEGTWRTWHANGRLYKEGELKDGLEHGRYLEYYESGLLRYEKNYELGKMNGLWRSWYADGDLESERTFKDDLLDGRWTQYDEDGKVLTVDEFKKGRVVGTTRGMNRRE